MKFVDIETVKSINGWLHKGPPKIRDAKLLDGALGTVKSHLGYFPNSPIGELAALYAFGIIANHPFVDGNKRTALITALVFLKINGYHLQHPSSDDARYMILVASNERTLNDLIEYFNDLVRGDGEEDTEGQWTTAHLLLNQYKGILKLLEDYDKGN